MNVLLIEPNSLLAGQYADYLSNIGCRVQRAADAQSAIVAADKQLPDVVVMELLLTSHSGVEFLYEFRSYAEWQKVPVIVLSSVRQTGLDPEAQKDLGVEVLYKPDITLEQLGKAVQRSAA